MNSSLIKSNPFEAAMIGSKPLLLDGAMGSYLQQKGLSTNDALWTTNINHTNPDVIVLTHLEYIDAGANIITTNTFRTNPSSLSIAGIKKSSGYVKKAVELARQAAIGKKVLIAGSNAPAEDCYQVERILSHYKLEMNHKNHIDLLIDTGVDFILNETQSHFDEIKIICNHCDQNDIPYVVSLYFNNKCELLSGESLKIVLDFLIEHNPMAIGFNCISIELFFKTFGSIHLPARWGFYLNCGSGRPTDKIIRCGVQPDEYLEIVKNTMAYNPSFIGSCCGSNPSHTQKIREYLDGQNYS